MLRFYPIFSRPPSLWPFSFTGVEKSKKKIETHEHMNDEQCPFAAPTFLTENDGRPPLQNFPSSLFLCQFLFFFLFLILLAVFSQLLNCLILCHRRPFLKRAIEQKPYWTGCECTIASETLTVFSNSSGTGERSSSFFGRPVLVLSSILCSSVFSLSLFFSPLFFISLLTEQLSPDRSLSVCKSIF